MGVTCPILVTVPAICLQVPPSASKCLQVPPRLRHSRLDAGSDGVELVDVNVSEVDEQ